MKSSRLLLSLTVAITACNTMGSTGPVQQTAVRIAPGAIRIDLLSPGNPESYWQYGIRPPTGEVTVISEARIPPRQEEGVIPVEYDKPAGKISACWKNPKAVSPDSRFVARCQNDFDRRDQFSVVDHDAFIIEDRVTNRKTFYWKMEERRQIQGFTWSPASDAVAVLNLRNDYVRFGFLGHMATPYSSVYLDVMTVDGRFTEYVVRRDVADAWARILNWASPEPLH